MSMTEKMYGLAILSTDPSWEARSEDELPNSRVQGSLTAHWIRVGVREHDAIASMTRFARALLTFGAPSVLVRGMQRAAADKVAHARLAFTLASRYAGHPVGRGALPMHGGADSAELESVIRALLREVCLGQTFAGIEAHYGAAVASDLQARAVLERIGRDDMHHAELGWKCVRWILATTGAQTRRFAECAVFDALVHARYAMRETPRDARASDVHALESHGVLSASRRALLRADAIERVLLPCARSLRGVGADELGETRRAS